MSHSRSMHFTALIIFGVLFQMPAAFGSSFVAEMGLKHDYTTYLHDFQNAGVFDDPISLGVKYWIPTQSNVEASIIYKFPVGGVISTASLKTEIAAYRIFDLGARAYLDVSSDSINWTTLIAHTPANYGNGLPGIYQYFDGDITPLVAGSSEIYVRARLLSTITHPTGQSFYSQFMRTMPSNDFDPRIVIRAEVLSIPEPGAAILCAVCSSSLLTLRGRGRRRQP